MFPFTNVSKNKIYFKKPFEEFSVNSVVSAFRSLVAQKALHPETGTQKQFALNVSAHTKIFMRPDHSSTQN